MGEYTPDKWVLIKIVHKETIYKVVGSWSGSYTSGDSWRINSGITSYTEDEDYYYFKGYSGSVYKCRKGMEGMTVYTAGVFEAMKKQALAGTDASLITVSIDDLEHLREGM